MKVIKNISLLLAFIFSICLLSNIFALSPVYEAKVDIPNIIDMEDVTLKIKFNEGIKSNVDDLKSRVSVAVDGENFSNLNSNDEVLISPDDNSTILIIFDSNTKLKSGTSTIKILSDSIKDNFNYVFEFETVATVLPYIFNIRNIRGGDWTTRVTNQGAGCGMCAIFGGVAGVESQYNVQENNSRLDVNLAEYTWGCGKGYTHTIYTTMITKPGVKLGEIKYYGMVDEACKPFGQTWFCDDWKERLWTMEGKGDAFLEGYFAGKSLDERIMLSKKTIIEKGAVTGLLFARNHVAGFIGWNDKQGWWEKKESADRFDHMDYSEQKEIGGIYSKNIIAPNFKSSTDISFTKENNIYTFNAYAHTVNSGQGAICDVVYNNDLYNTTMIPKDSLSVIAVFNKSDSSFMNNLKINCWEREIGIPTTYASPFLFVTPSSETIVDGLKPLNISGTITHNNYDLSTIKIKYQKQKGKKTTFDLSSIYTQEINDYENVIINVPFTRENNNEYTFNYLLNISAFRDGKYNYTIELTDNSGQKKEYIRKFWVAKIDLRLETYHYENGVTCPLGWDCTDIKSGKGISIREKKYSRTGLRSVFGSLLEDGPDFGSARTEPFYLINLDEMEIAISRNPYLNIYHPVEETVVTLNRAEDDVPICNFYPTMIPTVGVGENVFELVKENCDANKRYEKVYVKIENKGFNHHFWLKRIRFFDIAGERIYPLYSEKGEIELPTLIKTCQDLQNISLNLSKNYILFQNINCADFNFQPIGSLNNPFTGDLRGNNKIIYNLTINKSNNDYVGLFSALDNSQINNLGIGDMNINGNNYVGGLTGISSDDTKIINSYASGNISGNNYIGGLVGENRGEILNTCGVSKVLGESILGGTIGINKGKISNSCGISEVVGISKIGGLVGENRGEILNSYSIGKIEGESIIGGLVGNNNLGLINNTYAKQKINGNSNIGGISGTNNNEILNSYYDLETSIIDLSDNDYF